MVTEDGSDGLARAQLERIAFGPADTDDEKAAADVALRRIVEADADARALALAQSQVPATAKPIMPAAAGPDSATVAEPNTPLDVLDVLDILDVPDATPRPRRRLPVLPAAAAAVLLLAVVVGVFLTRTPAGVPAAASTSTSSPTPGVPNDPAAALKLLLLPQSTADTTFPMRYYAAALHIQPASIHIALETPAGEILWVGRAESDLCMMWTTQPDDGSIEGGVKCVTPGEFSRGGIRLTHGNIVWTWNGVDFAVTGT
jgi:hypothetical protein